MRRGDGAAIMPPMAPCTESHTFCWSFATMACSRTVGCTMKLPAADLSAPPKVEELSVQRPGSMQKTERSIGSPPAGTMRSLAMTRSCLPPVTISPAKEHEGLFRVVDQDERVDLVSAICRRDGTG
jgi:hypothetical protein